MEMKILTELSGMLEDINPVEITSHILDGTLMSWLASWKMKSQMLVAFLLENEKARLSESDLKIILNDIRRLIRIRLENNLFDFSFCRRD